MKPTLHSRISLSLALPVAAIVIACLLYGGFVRAAHTHDLEANERHAQHLECLLCMDANHLALPPALAPAAVFLLAWVVIVAFAAFAVLPRLPGSFYDARGPPRR